MTSDDMHEVPLGHLGPDLSASLDRELDTASLRRMEEHLEDCADCRDELAALERTRQAVRDLPCVEAPPGLIDRIVARRQGATRRAAALVGVAASLLAALSLVAVEPRQAPPGPTGPSPTPTMVRGDNGLIRLEAGGRTDRRDDGSEPSLLDRAHDAGEDLLELLTG
jgi:anti-sigma factor RsiW